MNPREAFRVFIRFQLNSAVEEGQIDLTSDQIEKIAEGVEDDSTFYDQLNEFLADYIESFGENYGI